MRGEKRRMPMPEYCCQLLDGDFCNLKFTSRIRNLDPPPMPRFSKLLLQSSDQDDVNVNDFLMICIICVTVLLLLACFTLCLSKALNMKRFGSFFSSDNKFVKINMNFPASEYGDEPAKVGLTKNY